MYSKIASIYDIHFEQSFLKSLQKIIQVRFEPITPPYRVHALTTKLSGERMR